MRTKALIILTDVLIQLLERVISRDKIVEHRAGGRKDTCHIVKDFAKLAHIVQKRRKAACVVCAADDRKSFFRSEFSIGNGAFERRVNKKLLYFAEMTTNVKSSVPATKRVPS